MHQTGSGSSTAMQNLPLLFGVQIKAINMNVCKYNIYIYIYIYCTTQVHTHTWLSGRRPRRTTSWRCLSSDMLCLRASIPARQASPLHEYICLMKHFSCVIDECFKHPTALQSLLANPLSIETFSTTSNPLAHVGQQALSLLALVPSSQCIHTLCKTPLSINPHS